MQNLKTPKQFIEFLKEKKVLRQFKDAVEEHRPGGAPDLETFLKYCEEDENIHGAVSEGFLWADTDPQEQGFDFWSNIDAEWHKRYYKDYK